MVDGRWTGAWAEVDADSSGLPPSALLPGPRRGRKPGYRAGGRITLREGRSPPRWTSGVRRARIVSLGGSVTYEAAVGYRWLRVVSSYSFCPPASAVVRGALRDPSRDRISSASSSSSAIISAETREDAPWVSTTRCISKPWADSSAGSAQTQPPITLGLLATLATTHFPAKIWPTPNSLADQGRSATR